MSKKSHNLRMKSMEETCNILLAMPHIVSSDTIEDGLFSVVAFADEEDRKMALEAISEIKRIEFVETLAMDKKHDFDKAGKKAKDAVNG